MFLFRTKVFLFQSLVASAQNLQAGLKTARYKMLLEMKKEIENIMEVLSKNAWNRREKKIHRLEEQAMNQYDQLVKMFDNAFLTPTPSNFESAH